MTPAVVELRRWSPRCRIAVTMFLLCAQVGLVLWLSDRRPAYRRPLGPSPSLQFAANQSDELDYSEVGVFGGAPSQAGSAANMLQALADPTLFALPHQKGFSGPRWNPSEFRPFAWSEPLEWLVPSAQLWNGPFKPVIPSNASGPLLAMLEAAPDLTLPEVSPLAPSREKSAFHIEGELASRRLLTPLSLKSWVTSDMLTNTVVQVLVDADGRPLSALLLSACGLGDADHLALEQAQSARFAAVSTSGPDRALNAEADLMWGTIVFEWHTLPAPTAAAPPSAP
jgi:hypothetical protein